MKNSSAKKRILIVDDHEDIAYYLSTLLENEQTDIKIATNGIRALEIASEFHPEFILMDLNMPKLDGNDACRVIREQHWGKEVKLIAITGFDLETYRHQAKNAGFDHYLTKPLDYKQLEDLLSK